MIAEVYDALLSAGADDGKARRAAEVLADCDTRFKSLERRIDVFEANVNGRFMTLEANMNGKFAQLYWMLAALIAGLVSVILKLYI